MKTIRIMSITGIVVSGFLVFLGLAWVSMAVTDNEFGLAFWMVACGGYSLAQSIVGVVKTKSEDKTEKTKKNDEEMKYIPREEIK